jgi:tRNA (cmo5U34)-methyltransferase
MTRARDFSFGANAAQLDPHIQASVRDYPGLRAFTTQISSRFIGANTNVYDLGTSTGTLLRSVYDDFNHRRPGVTFHGIDLEPQFEDHWQTPRASDLTYSVADARQFDIKHASLVISIFTVQFLPAVDKVPLLKRIHAGMNDGGCLLIAEKVLAETGRMQDALTFPYYDFKRANGFSAEEILNKERSLRGQMTLWTEKEIEIALRQSGFGDVQRIWGNFPFFCWLASKNPSFFTE